MELSLPRTTQLQLEQTLGQWRHWRCTPALDAAPQVVRLLAPGRSNYSILVTSGRSDFVVRLDRENPRAHGLSRQSEWAVLQCAAAQDIAPQPRYFNPDLGSLVCDYLPQDEQPRHDPEPSANLQHVGKLLRAIHALPAVHHRLDLPERIRRYEKQLVQRGRPLPAAHKARQAIVLALLREIDLREEAAVLCHNDLLHANRSVSGGTLRAIDWEYCAMGSPWYDLAVVSVGDELTPSQQSTLLHSYLRQAPGAAERDTLLRYSIIYGHLEILWYLALEQPVFDATSLDRKEAALQALLRALDRQP